MVYSTYLYAGSACLISRICHTQKIHVYAVHVFGELSSIDYSVEDTLQDCVCPLTPSMVRLYGVQDPVCPLDS